MGLFPNPELISSVQRWLAGSADIEMKGFLQQHVTELLIS